MEDVFSMDTLEEKFDVTDEITYRYFFICLFFREINGLIFYPDILTNHFPKNSLALPCCYINLFLLL
jgi:hypothetical protein